ncbi:MAG: TRAP transporter small permease [Bacteroidota bacterium]
MTQLEVIKNKVDKLLELMLVVVLSVLVLDVLWQVASRYLLSDPSNFTDEVASFLLIWVGLLGASYVTGKRQHLALNILLNKLSTDNLRHLKLVIHLITIAFAIAVMMVGGIWLIYTRFHLGQVSASLQIPIGYVYLVIPLSGTFIIFYSVVNAIEDFKTDTVK